MLALQSQKHVSASNVCGRRNVKTSKVSMRIKHERTHVKVPFKKQKETVQKSGQQHPAPRELRSQQLALHLVTQHLTALLSAQGDSRLEAKLPPCQMRAFKEKENRTMQMSSFQTLHNNQVNTIRWRGWKKDYTPDNVGLSQDAKLI